MEWLVSWYRVWMSHDHAHKTVQPQFRNQSSCKQTRGKGLGFLIGFPSNIINRYYKPPGRPIPFPGEAPAFWCWKTVREENGLLCLSANASGVGSSRAQSQETFHYSYFLMLNIEFLTQKNKKVQTIKGRGLGIFQQLGDGFVLPDHLHLPLFGHRRHVQVFQVQSVRRGKIEDSGGKGGGLSAGGTGNLCPRSTQMFPKVKGWLGS